MRSFITGKKIKLAKFTLDLSITFLSNSHSGRVYNCPCGNWKIGCELGAIAKSDYSVLYFNFFFLHFMRLFVRELNRITFFSIQLSPCIYYMIIFYPDFSPRLCIIQIGFSVLDTKGAAQFVFLMKQS